MIAAWLVFLVIAVLPVIFRSSLAVRAICVCALCSAGVAYSFFGAGQAARAAGDLHAKQNKPSGDFYDGARQTALLARSEDINLTLPIFVILGVWTLIPYKNKQSVPSLPAI